MTDISSRQQRRILELDPLRTARSNVAKTRLLQHKRARRERELLIKEQKEQEEQFAYEQMEKELKRRKSETKRRRKERQQESERQRRDQERKRGRGNHSASMVLDRYEKATNKVDGGAVRDLSIYHLAEAKKSSHLTPSEPNELVALPTIQDNSDMSEYELVWEDKKGSYKSSSSRAIESIDEPKMEAESNVQSKDYETCNRKRSRTSSKEERKLKRRKEKKDKERSKKKIDKDLRKEKEKEDELKRLR